ncbi:MAG: OmpH family outer membrane protein [Planctomycetes bacterium]|nr:OmpH family outer membrane protein [Planctomycetota bacterium]
MTHVRFFLATLTLVMCGAARSSAQDATPSEQPQLPAADPSLTPAAEPPGANRSEQPQLNAADPSALGTPSDVSAHPSDATPFSSFGAFGGLGGFGGAGADLYGAGIDSAAAEARFIASGAIIITWSENKDAAWGFSKTTGKWTRQELKPPGTEPPMVGDRLGVIQAGSTIYAYSGQAGRWDVLRLPADHHPQVGLHEEFVLVNDGSDIYTFADATGRWTSPDGENVNEGPEQTENRSLFGLGFPGGSPMANVSDVSASVEDLSRKHQELDQTSAQLAGRYREQSATIGPNHPDLQRLKERLAEVVKQAFQARQQLHQAELAEFQRRMQDIQRTIEARQRIQGDIIERRVNELLDPSLQWDAAAPQRATGGGTPSGQVGRRSAGRGPGVVASASPIDPPTAEDDRRPQRELGDLPSPEQLVGVGSFRTRPIRSGLSFPARRSAAFATARSCS